MKDKRNKNEQRESQNGAGRESILAQLRQAQKERISGNKESLSKNREDDAIELPNSEKKLFHKKRPDKFHSGRKKQRPSRDNENKFLKNRTDDRRNKLSNKKDFKKTNFKDRFNRDQIGKNRFGSNRFEKKRGGKSRANVGVRATNKGARILPALVQSKLP
jgi:hypothetical protein